MRVLVACEFSAVVRDAFRARGHEAYSCDLLPTEGDPEFHFQCNVRRVLTQYPSRYFDLMIAHPECTYICNSGVRWLYKLDERDPERWAAMEKGARFLKYLLELKRVDRICVENPIPHRYAVEIIGSKPTQYIQPWQYGHGETKKTGLWLKNLPLLEPTKIVSGRVARVHKMSPGPDRWKERSRTLTGIAEAMADQWGSLRG